MTDNPDHIISAQKLHAEVYVRKGFIYEHDVGADGRIKRGADPYQETATYFVVTQIDEKGKEVVVATARHITGRKKDWSDLPLLQQARLQERYVAEIKQYQPSQCVEVSGLVKRRGYGMIATLLLYRVMWQHSWQRQDKVWLMACSPALYKRLRQLFGSTLTQIGPPTPYTGEEIIPVMLKVEEGEARLHRAAKKSWNPGKRLLYRELLAFFTKEDHFLVRRYD